MTDFPRGWGSHEKFCQDIRCPVRDSNRAPPPPPIIHVLNVAATRTPNVKPAIMVFGHDYTIQGSIF
jgi:hypothetical protein